jgi:hypothetical protein
LEVVSLLGAEGLVSMIEEQVNSPSGEEWDTWADLNYRLAADPSIHGGVEHLLAVTVKPHWRPALGRIARKLEAAGVAYRVVGGAVAALYGVPLPVNDLDFELDGRDVYRFQELFSDFVAQPVSWRESETYRSHFGRLNFGGVSVEMMGDLERRDGGRWVPSRTRTEATVTLDGVPVRVPWLEEVTLESIRRGRLERAAHYLPHCDPDRLTALLRGEQRTEVL